MLNSLVMAVSEHIALLYCIVFDIFLFAGDALHKHLDRIIPALISSITETPDSLESAEGVVLSVQNEPGPSHLLDQLLKAARDTKLDRREAAMTLLHAFCGRSPADLSDYVPQLIIFTTEALNDPSEKVCTEAWFALEAIVKVSSEFCVYISLVTI